MAMEDRRSGLRTMPKNPQMIKASLRPLKGKAQLFPNDVSTIVQALMDLSDNLIELQEQLKALEATAAEAGSARHAAGTASPAEAATDA